MSIANEVVFITGATSGIGEALALRLARKNTVIAAGRKRDALDKLEQKSDNIRALAMDVADASQVGANRQKLAEISPHIDRVVLNAGNCIYLEPENMDWSAFEKLMSVNFFGWIHTLQSCLPLLEKASRPHIVGIGSQVIYAPFPKAAAYGASKAAASYFLKSLALDIHYRNIDVSLLHPGFVDTPLTQQNDFEMPFLMSVEKASQEIVDAMDKRKREYAFPRKLRYMLALSKLLPDFWFNKMRYRSAKI